MSNSHYTYFGAFAKIEEPKIQKIEYYNGCRNVNCKLFVLKSDGSFCSACGNNICELEDTNFHTYTYEEWVEVTNNVDKMMSMTIGNGTWETYLFPNFKNISDQTSAVNYWGHDVDPVIDCSDINPAEMQKAFMTLHDDILTQLQAAGFVIKFIFGFFNGVQC